MATLYKLMSFGPHTRLSLFMLFRHKALFFARPAFLNDPTDCTPNLIEDVDETSAATYFPKLIEADETLDEPAKDYAMELVSGKAGAIPESPLYNLGTVANLGWAAACCGIRLLLKI